ncbi:MAG: hypothetical protein RI988_10 [Pseudomonadota bacterium]
MKRSVCFDVRHEHASVAGLDRGAVSRRDDTPATPLPRTTGRDPGARNRLNDELWLVEMVLRIERDRTIALAERWGHVGFANFLRERMAGNAALGE